MSLRRRYAAYTALSRLGRYATIACALAFHASLAANVWLDENICDLHMDVGEKYTAYRGALRYSTSTTAQPTLIIGAYPVASSILVAQTTAIILREYLGYKEVDVQLTGFHTAHLDLMSGDIHLLMDFRPFSSFSSSAAIADFYSDPSVVMAGALGLTSRPGLYMSLVLAERMRQLLISGAERMNRAADVEALVGIRFSHLPWDSLVALLSLYGVDPAEVQAAVASEVLVPADDPTAALRVWGESGARLCVDPRSTDLGTSPTKSPDPRTLPARVLKPFFAVGIIVACRFVYGGEDGLRAAMDAKVAQQAGRADLLVVIPSSPSDLVLDGKYGLIRMPLIPYYAGCAADAQCDWPQDVLQKVASSALRDFFPTDVLHMVEVSGHICRRPQASGLNGPLPGGCIYLSAPLRLPYPHLSLCPFSIPASLYLSLYLSFCPSAPPPAEPQLRHG